MSFLLGLFTATVFFLCLLFSYWLGTKNVQKKPPDKVEDETIRKQKQLQEEFIKVMNYDVKQATARKQVK